MASPSALTLPAAAPARHFPISRRGRRAPRRQHPTGPLEGRDVRPCAGARSAARSGRASIVARDGPGLTISTVMDVPIVPALWDTPWMFRMRQRKADDFDEGRAADSVLGETASRFGRRFRAAVSPRGSIGKIRLSLSAYSGTQFPLEARLGNRGPFRPPIPGCAFR